MVRFDRDCNTCIRHVQARGISGTPIGCWSCLSSSKKGGPYLPKWESPMDLQMEHTVTMAGEKLKKATEQSRKESLLESILNTFSGWLISLVLWMFLIAPAFGIQSSLTESALINGIFTGTSIVRGYFWRRLFVNKFWRREA